MLKRSRSVWLKRTVGAVSVFCLLIGGILAYQYYSATHGTIELDPSQTVVSDSQPPSEQQPIITARQTDSLIPQRITIPSINVDGPIQKVGLTAENRLAAPNNINVAGWYEGGPLPGGAGVSVIDGHVNGKYSDGIFKQLNKVAVGAEINVSFGNGQNKTFVVTKIIEITVAAAGDAMFANPNNAASALNLITCSGRYDRSAGTYDQRIILYTSLKS